MGSPGGFEQFQEDYGRLVAYSRPCGPAPVMAEDAAVEAMAKVMEAWDEVGHARAWVRTKQIVSPLDRLSKRQRDVMAPVVEELGRCEFVAEPGTAENMVCGPMSVLPVSG